MLLTLRRLSQLFACAALMFSSRAVHAQGSIAGRVLADQGRAPVAGAELVLRGTNRTVTTDSAGRYSFRDLPQGVLVLITRAVGFAPDTFRAEFFDESLSRDVILKASVTTLGEVRVRDSAPVAAKLMAFEERRRANAGGHFIDSTVIAKWEYRKAGDLLSTVSGVDVQRQRGEAYLTGSRATQPLTPSARPVPCFMDVYLDGAPLAIANTRFDINSIGLNHVAAIEVYSSTSRIPAQYNRTSRGCGVVLLWTK